MHKALLDENLPAKLKFRLQNVCTIYTVNDKAWSSLENGDLIEVMQKAGFDYLITSDKNLQHQQNIANYSIGIIVLNVMNNNYETILPLLDAIKQVLVDETKVKLKVIS